MLASTREEEVHPLEMGFGHCFNHNSKHRQKARTLQPDGRMYLMHKYFESAAQMPITYENVPVEQDLGSPMLHQTVHRLPHIHHHSRQVSRHSHRSHSHPHHHDRSHSQHYYQPMVSQGPNELNWYYNVVQPNITRSRHSPINEPPRPALNQPAQLDCITVMQVCNELGNNIDSSPPMPPPRNYSVSHSHTSGSLVRINFPQARVMRVDLTDKYGRNKLIKSGEPISVLCPSKEDRSKFTICYKDSHYDVPHQYTQPPQVCLNLGYGQRNYIDSHNLTMRHQLADQTHISTTRK